MNGWSIGEIQRRLATVQEDLRGARLSQALAGLLELWGETRDAAIALRIFELDGLLARHRAQIPRTSVGRVSQAGWLQREAIGHPADVSLLMAVLTEDAGQKHLRQRLQRLQQRPPDPRIFAALTERTPRRSVVGPSFDPALIRHADPHASRTGRSPALLREMERLSEVRIDVPAEATGSLGSATQEAVEGPRKRVWYDYRPPRPHAQLESLWREVVAHPDDDGPRHVFADLLADLDPDLARFVQLQLAAGERPLSRSEGTKMRRTIRNRLGDLLGPLSGAVLAKGVEFSRGFLHAGNVLTTAREARELGDDFRWGTARALACRHGAFFEGDGVRELRCAGTRYVERALASGESAWVRRRGGVAMGAAPLRQLRATGASPRWRVLQITGSPEESWDGLELPRLETLVIDGFVWPRLDAFPNLRHLVVPLATDLSELGMVERLASITLVYHDAWQFRFDAATPEGRLVWTGGGPPPDDSVRPQRPTVLLPGLAREVARAGIHFASQP